MVAKGKVNASKVEVGQRIIVQVSELSGHVSISYTKTGEGVQVARVIGKTAHMVFTGRRQNRVYTVVTSAGSFQAAPIETMMLAPEDNAGIKRAYAEAVAEDMDRARQARENELWVPIDEAHELALAEAAEREIEERAAEVEAYNLAEAEKARAANEAPGGMYHGTEWASSSNPDDLPDPDGSNTLPVPPEFFQGEDLTLHSQDGKVDNMNNDASTEAPATTNATGSTVITLLEKVWARIREDHPELPEIVIITGSGLVGGSKWGHFRPEGWKDGDKGRKHELFLAGEALAKGAAQVFQTLLHEAAHALACVRKVQDTSRQGRWHNANFRKLAEEMGLEHKAASADGTHGFSFVTLTQATKDRYADLLAELDAEIRLTCHLPAWLGGSEEQDGEDKGGEKITGRPAKGTGGSTSNNVKAVCRCETPRIIRVSRKVLEEAGIMCRECDSDFEAA